MWETVPPIYIVSIYSSGEFFSFVLIAWNVEQEKENKKTAITTISTAIRNHLRSSVFICVHLWLKKGVGWASPTTTE